MSSTISKIVPRSGLDDEMGEYGLEDDDDEVIEVR